MIGGPLADGESATSRLLAIELGLALPGAVRDEWPARCEPTLQRVKATAEQADPQKLAELIRATQFPLRRIDELFAAADKVFVGVVAEPEAIRAAPARCRAMRRHRLYDAATAGRRGERRRSAPWR